MFGECHAHVIMDGKNYKKAIELHKDKPDETWIREVFEIYRQKEVPFVRDGGDNLGVSALAKKIAPEYGIDYRTPVFAVHKKGHYGSIVGRSFSDLKEYHDLVLKAKEQGADFIKIMTTGILDFNNQGQVTGSPLESEEVREMVHIAHGEGLAVMSHTNGVYGARAAIEAGVDSLEHGNYMDEETVKMLADSPTVWVPTLVTIRNLSGCGRYAEETLKPIVQKAEEMLRLAYRYHAHVALGSDAGAYMVEHGSGICQEYEAFRTVLGNPADLDAWLEDGEKRIMERFQ